MRVGINYPIGPDDPVDRAFMSTLKRYTQADVLRFNMRIGAWQNGPAVDAAVEAGFKPLVILDMPYDDVTTSAEAYVDFCREACSHSDIHMVEFGNEPVTRPGGGRPMGAFEYVRYAESAGLALRGQVTRYLAMDAMRPGGWAAHTHMGWWRMVRKSIDPNAWDGAAIHPYRDGRQPPDQSRIAWPQWGWLHRNPSIGTRLRLPVHRRGEEHETWIRESTRPLVVTEIGYSTRYMNAEVAAERLTWELEFYQRAGVDLVCIYAHVGDEWGVLGDHWNPRPQAGAIRAWVEAHAN